MTEDNLHTKVDLENGSPAFAKPVLAAVPFSEVYLEDCTEALKRFDNNHFDLAIVDPPYGFRTEKTGILNFRKGKQEKECSIEGLEAFRSERHRGCEMEWISSLVARAALGVALAAAGRGRQE